MAGNEIFFNEVEDEMQIIRNFVQHRFISYLKE